MQEFKDILNRNKWAIGLFFATVLAVIVVMCFRWWSLVIVPSLVAAVFFGHLMDKGGTEAVKAFFEKLFAKRG